MKFTSRSNLLAIGFIFPIISAALICARFYFHHSRRAIGIDDWLTLPAWLGLVGTCVALMVGVFKQAFASQNPNGQADMHVFARVVAALPLCWTYANGLTKLSIIFFYRRVFIGRIFGIITWTLIGTTITWMVYNTIADIIYCGSDVRSAVEGPWTDCPTWGITLQVPVYIVDTVLDLALIILPIPYLWALQLSRLKKVLLVLTFTLGCLAFVAGFVNTVIQLLLILQPNSFANATLDTVIYALPVIEVGIGLIACNLPTLSGVATRFIRMYIIKGWFRLKYRVRHGSTTCVNPPTNSATTMVYGACPSTGSSNALSNQFTQSEIGYEIHLQDEETAQMKETRTLQCEY